MKCYSQAKSDRLLDAPYYVEISPEYAAMVHSTAWDVVSVHPYAGIAPFDHDRDNLPNDWEKNYFGGTTNANPAATASNGINTLLETYIAGLNPTDPSALFTLSKDWKTLWWSAASGRVYSVHWTSNLLDSFQTLESNLTGGAFTDLVRGAEDQGFYRLDVQLAP